jgi:GT2 family glycosyltransferase
LLDHLRRPGGDRVCAVAPRQIGDDGVEQRVVWPLPTPQRAWLEAVGLGNARARRTFLTGAVLLLRWQALAEVGMFDERFFLYAEEADWQHRARNAGWVPSLCPAVTAQHEGAGTSVGATFREVLFHAGQETYIRKWHGRVGWMTYRVAAVSGASVRALVLTGSRRAEARRRVTLYLRGPRRCLTTAVSRRP